MKKSNGYIINIKLLKDYNISDVVVMSIIFYRYFSYKNVYSRVNVKGISNEIKLGDRQIYNVIAKMVKNGLLEYKSGGKNSKLYRATEKFKKIMFYKNGYFYLYKKDLMDLGYKASIVYDFFKNKWDYWNNNSKDKVGQFIHIDFNYLQRILSISKNSLINIFKILEDKKRIIIKTKGYPRKRYYKLILNDNDIQNNSLPKNSHTNKETYLNNDDKSKELLYKRLPASIKIGNFLLEINKFDFKLNLKNISFNPILNKNVYNLFIRDEKIELDLDNPFLYRDIIIQKLDDSYIKDEMKKINYRISVDYLLYHSIIKKSDIANKLNNEDKDIVKYDLILAYIISKLIIPNITPYKFLEILDYLFNSDYWSSRIKYFYELFNKSNKQNKYIIEIIYNQVFNKKNNKKEKIFS